MAKYKPVTLGSISPFKNKKIVFATPHRVEMILLAFYMIFFFWWDVLNNILLAKGTDHQVVWFDYVTKEGITKAITTPALDLAIIVLILFHIVLMAIFLFSLKSETKATNKFYDIAVGTLAFFGVAILLAGFVNTIYSPTIHFLFVNMGSVTFYHIGVGIELFCGLWWAFTK